MLTKTPDTVLKWIACWAQLSVRSQRIINRLKRIMLKKYLVLFSVAAVKVLQVDSGFCILHDALIKIRSSKSDSTNFGVIDSDSMDSQRNDVIGSIANEIGNAFGSPVKRSSKKRLPKSELIDAIFDSSCKQRRFWFKSFSKKRRYWIVRKSNWCNFWSYLGMSSAG